MQYFLVITSRDNTTVSIIVNTEDVGFICLCSSAHKFNIDWLITPSRYFDETKPEVIETFKRRSEIVSALLLLDYLPFIDNNHFAVLKSELFNEL